MRPATGPGRGRDFGHASRGVVGLSDDNDGVHWHAPYYVREGAAWLGVNLGGKKYDGWPLARVIERELVRPLLLTRYQERVADQGRGRRALDAGSVAGRLPRSDQGAEPRTHADHSGPACPPGLGGGVATRARLPGSEAELSRSPTEGHGHAGRVQTTGPEGPARLEALAELDQSPQPPTATVAAPLGADGNIRRARHRDACPVDDARRASRGQGREGR